MSIIGRACEKLTCHLEKTGAPEGECPLLPYLGKDLENIMTFEIDSYGWVLLCPGISVGNAKKTPLSQIVEEYDVCNPCLRKDLQGRAQRTTGGSCSQGV